jgi:ABC 3 transport family
MISLGCQFGDSERDVTGMMAVAVVSAGISSYAGLLLSYHASLPSGPAIILAARAHLCTVDRAWALWWPDLARFAAATPSGVTGF